MDTNTTDKKKIPRASFVFCLAIGIIMLIIATVSLIRLNASKKDFIKIDAIVSKVDDNVYINYNYNTDDYTNVPITMVNRPAVGKTIQVYINKEDYAEVASDEPSLYIIRGFFITGGIFFAAGAVSLIARRLVMGKSNPILEGGKYIYADVDEVICEMGITGENGAHPYTIRCHYEDFSGKKRQDYVLKDIYINPTAYLAANKKKLKIYIKGNNYKKYYFDQTILKL